MVQQLSVWMSMARGLPISGKNRMVTVTGPTLMEPPAQFTLNTLTGASQAGKYRALIRNAGGLQIISDIDHPHGHTSATYRA